MNKEEVYKFGDFVIAYDKGVNNDRSCLIISKVDKINIYVLGELYDESADIVNTIINNLQQENKQLKERIDNQEFLLKSQGKELKELYLIIDKAIEYINTIQPITQPYGKTLMQQMLNELLEILKGE